MIHRGRVGWVAVALAVLVVCSAPASAAAGDELWSHSNHSTNVQDVESTTQYIVSGGSGSGIIDARDHSGTQQWQHSRLGSVQGVGVGGGFVAVVNDSGDVDVADISDGSQVSTYSISGIGRDIVVDGSIVAAGTTDGKVRAADPDTGDELWTTNEPDTVQGVALTNDYVIAGTNDAGLYAFDRSDGSVVWRNSSAFGIGEIKDVAAAGDTLAVVGEGPDAGDAVAAFNVKTGDRRWLQTPHSNTPAGVDIDGGTIVSGGYDEDIIATDPTTGRERFRHSLHSGGVLGVTVQGTLIASGDTGGNVIAAENGPNLQNPSPTVGQYFDEIDLEVDVADTGGDSYTVRFINATNGNGSAIDSQSVTGDEAVSTTWEIDGDEPSSWYATIRDGKGNELDRTKVFDLNIPATLYLRNETRPSDLVDDSVSVTVRFFGDDGGVVERTTTDGTIDMSGLPRDQPFVVDADTDGDFLSRTIYIQTIFEQQSMYLLNRSVAPTSEVRFELDDSTGEYDSSSVLIVQKPIERNGETQYRTIVGDRFGVEGVTDDLQADRRYRIKVRNEAGDEQVVGPYRADVSETVQVRPGAPTIELDSFRETWGYGAEATDRRLEYRYNDTEQATDRVTVYIHERGNESNQLQPNQTYFDVGSVSNSVAFSGSENDTEWVVVFDIQREDGTTFITREVVGATPDLVPGLNREWRLIAAIMMLFVSAGAFSVLNSAIGGVVVSIQGGILWWTGFLEGATSAVLITFALFISVLTHIYTKSGP